MITFSRLGKVGRLGNQLFQIAFITHFANKYRIPYSLPEWKYAAYFEQNINFTNELPECYDLILKEPTLGYNEDYYLKYLSQMKSGNVDIITGYFQSYKYFTKSHILSVFKPSNKFRSITINPEKSVAISVRRGDFVSHKDYNNIDASVFRVLLENFKNYKVFVFTDDFGYCKREFIGNEFEFMEGLNDIEQLITLSKFDYFILSNSTFSYWGPMLSPSPKKVYFPYFMFPDLKRCSLYNRDYWPHEKEVYIPYINPINKAIKL